MADGIARFLDQPDLAWTHADDPSVVEMAQLRSGESTLALACQTGLLLQQVIRIQGSTHGRLVGVDPSRGQLQEAVRKFEARGYDGMVDFLLGDPPHLHQITGLRDPHHPTSLPTFDTIFARHAVPADIGLVSSTLQHWGSYITPRTGRIVATFNLGTPDAPRVAGIQVVDGTGNILATQSWILEDDWEQLEDSVRALAGAAGLAVVELRCLSFQGPVTDDVGASFEAETQQGFQTLRETEPDSIEPEWVNADGTFSSSFKHLYLWQSWELSEGEKN
ncbi:MAG: hypothetical protein L6R38_003736 [Xanthoria sp. 2 TBL-2021]|nr:MAG: hypothetical protein L6R38_003736 [Xanthoria sp. 2 TBL-2021]